MPEGNPLVAQAQSQTTGITGIGIAESSVDLANGVKDGSWVEFGMGALGVGLEVLSMVVDPIGTLAQYGVSWLIEHVQPLKEALDWLAGDPPVIQSFSDTWANVAKEVDGVAKDLKTQGDGGTAGWEGEAGDAYRGESAERADAIQGAATLADGISVGVMIMGQVVSMVRELVRDLVAELVGKLITWALEAAATLGFATPLIAVQATTAITKAISKVGDTIRKLVKTIGNVSPKIKKIIDKLGEIMEKLAKLGRKLGGKADGTSPSAAKAGPKVDGPDVPKGGDTTPSGSSTTPSSTSTSPDTTPSTTKPDSTSPSSTSPDGSSPDTPSTGKTDTPASAKDSPDGSLRKDAENPVARSKDRECRYPGLEPVDLATGEMYLTQNDLEFEGLPRFVLQRIHVSSYRSGRLFGPSWASTLDQRLEIDDRGVCYAGPDGEILVYPAPAESREVLPAEGARWPLARSADGGYTITQPQSGRTLLFGADRSGVSPLMAILDRNGNRIEFDYDPSGVLAAVRHSGGYTVDVETDRGRVTGLRLTAAGAPPVDLVRYGYDAEGRLTEVTNSSGRPLRFDYDAAGRIVRWEDRNGEWYAYGYDQAGRCVRTEGSGGALSGSLEFDLTQHVTRETNSLGHVTEHHFNELNQLVRRIDPLGNETSFEWDRYNRLLWERDPLGRGTRYRYDERGNVTQVVHPDGTESSIEYNEPGLPVTAVEPDGSVRRYEYDERGNRTKVIDATGAVTAFAYDARGFLTATTDHFGNVTRVQTDDAGLPVLVTDPLGGTVRYRRDQFGRVVSITDPVGGETRLGWTVEGRLLFRTRPDGATERWSYDGEGNEAKRVDANGNVTRIETTHFDFLAAQTDPDGARFEFTYDTEMRLTKLRNPQGLEWTYDYDPAGNLIGEVDFNGREIGYRRDAAGQLVERVNGAGETTAFLRDTMGRIIERRCGEASASFEYDPAGRLVRALNEHADVVFRRDQTGRVLSETVNGRTVTMVYDALGRRTHRRTPSGTESVWRYDANHRPARLSVGGRTMTFGFDAAGREVERLHDTGTVFAQTWTPTHQLDSQTVSSVAPGPSMGRTARVIQRRRYSYRADGNVRAIEDAGGVRNFDLDPTGRVAAISGDGIAERYSYDPSGNIEAAAWLGPDTDSQGIREYDGTLLRRAGNLRYGYDRQGRMVLRQRKRLSAKPDTWHYTWDSEDRLVGVTTPDGAEWRYRYDALGRRIAKQRLNPDRETVVEQVDFVWDGAVLAEQIQGGTRATAWEHAPNGTRVLAQVERRNARDAEQEWVDEQFYSIVTDLVGGPTELIDAGGNLAWRRKQTLWGEALAQSGNAAETPLRFPGQYFDAETGLHYNHHRYYDPASGRYLSNDPLGLEGGFNPQAYVPNPATWLDPLGLKADDTCPPGGDYVPLYKAPQRGLGQQQYDSGYRAGDYGERVPGEGGAFFARDPELANHWADIYKDGVIEVRVPASDYADNFARYEQPYPDNSDWTEVEIPGSEVEKLNPYHREWHKPHAPTGR